VSELGEVERRLASSAWRVNDAGEHDDCRGVAVSESEQVEDVGKALAYNDLKATRLRLVLPSQHECHVANLRLTKAEVAVRVVIPHIKRRICRKSTHKESSCFRGHQVNNGGAIRPKFTSSGASAS
jgi:hypothetical protein